MKETNYRGVIFDLFTALLDSWTLWNDVAGLEGAGFRWRMRYLELTYQAGAYRRYESIIEESARDVGLSPRCPAELIARWAELRPWPEASRVVGTLTQRVPAAIATNASVELGNLAASTLGVPDVVVVTSEEAGYYKPAPQPYRMALDRIGCSPDAALFVAGSPADVGGAKSVGMNVFWHNRLHLAPTQLRLEADYVSDSLNPVLELFRDVGRMS